MIAEKIKNSRVKQFAVLLLCAFLSSFSALIALGELPGSNKGFVQAKAATTVIDEATSSNGRLSVVREYQSPIELGDNVIYTYTVHNNYSSSLPVYSVDDTRCDTVTRTSGNLYIPSGGSNTYTCTNKEGQAGTFNFQVFVNSSGSANDITLTGTTTIEQGEPWACDAIVGAAGDYGQDVGWEVYRAIHGTSTGNPSIGVSGYTIGTPEDGATNVAISPGGNFVYWEAYFPDDSMWRYNTTTGLRERMANTPSRSFGAATSPDGTLWILGRNGNLYYMTNPDLPANNSQWNQVDIVGEYYWDGTGMDTNNPQYTDFGYQASTYLDFGDILFDENGDMWILATDAEENNGNGLYIAEAADLSSGNNVVAKQITHIEGVTSETVIEGAAFGADNVLYTSHPNSNDETVLATLDPATGTVTPIGTLPSPYKTIDLASCVYPDPDGSGHIEVEKTVSPAGSMITGQEAEYTINVSNTGSILSINNSLKDLLPSGVNLVADSITLNGVTQPNNSLSESIDLLSTNSTVLGVILPGESAVVKFRVTPDANLTSFCNQAIVKSGDSTLLSDDPNTSDTGDATCLNVVAANPSINVDKTGNVESTTETSVDVTYTYTVTNDGNEPLSGVTVGDNVCTTVSLLTPNTTNNTGDLNNNGILETNETWIYQCAQTLTETTTNTATASGTGAISGGTAQDTDTWTVTFNNSNLNLVKSFVDTTGPDTSGNLVANYTVKVINSGQIAGAFTQINDTLAFDDDLNPISVAWTGLAVGSVQLNGADTFTLPGGTVANNNEVVYNVAVTYEIDTTLGDGIVTNCDGNPNSGLYNSASLPTGEEDGPTDDNATCGDPLNPTAGISVSKTSTTTTLDAPADVTYAYAVTNSGSEPLGNVQISDNVCPTVAYVNGDTNNNSFLESGETWNYSCTQNIDETTTNTVSVSGVGSSSGATAQATDTWTVTVSLKALNIQKYSGECANTTCPLVGAQFILFEGSVSNDNLINNSVTLDGADAEGNGFNTIGLKWNTDYWLVESVAPQGYHLLAPVKFQVTNSGINIIDDTSGLVAVNASNVFAFDVFNLPAIMLPATGGLGNRIGMSLPVGATVLLAGLYLMYRRPEEEI